MSRNLTVLEPTGNLVNQASQQAKASTVFGEKTEKIMSTPQSVEGQFGNFSGDVSMANSITNMATKLDDAATRERNLTRANEAERRKLHLAEFKEADYKAQAQVDEVARMQEVNADDREQLYNQYLDSNISAINTKYKYKTEIGNNVDEENERILIQTRLGFKKENEQYRVAEYKTVQKMAWDKSISNVTEGIRRGGDAAEAFQQLTQTFRSVDGPEFHGVYGIEADATKLAWKRAALKDVIMSLPTASAVAVLGFDGPPEKDPLAMMDPSDRVTLHRQMNGILKAEQSEIEKARIEAQTQKLTVYVDAARETNDPKQLAKYYQDLKAKRDSGEVDIKAANPILGVLDSRMDTLIRRAQSDAHTAAIRAQTETNKRIAAEAKAEQRRLNAFSGVPKDNNDYYVQNILPLMKGKSAIDQVRIQEQYIADSGRVPQVLRHELEKMSNSADPKLAQAGIERLRRIEQLSPQAYADLPKDVVALDLISRRSPISVAQEKVRANRARGDEERARAKKRAEKETKDSFIKDQIKEHFGKSSVSPSIIEAIRTTTIDFMDTYNDPEDAAVAAMRHWEAKGYGVTELGGKNMFVPYPAEKTYANEMGGEDNVVKAWERDVIKKHKLDDDARPLFSGRVDKNGKPIYFIVDGNGNKVFNINKTTNTVELDNPLMWQPKYEDTDTYKEAKAKEKETQQSNTKPSPLLKNRWTNTGVK